MTLPRPLQAYADNSIPQVMSAMMIKQLDALSAAFPAAAEHRRLLRLLGSEFVYAAPLADRYGGVSREWVTLIRLHPSLERRFSINSEILCLYTPQIDLQGRTIEKLRDIESSLPTQRRSIARNIYFVSAPDTRLSNKLHEFSRPDRTLLPLQGRGNAESAERLLESVGMRLYTRDLYSEHSYVTGDQFFGRQRLLQEIAADISARRIPAVFGMRKTGKTSILREIQRTALAQDFEGRRPVFVYSDLEFLPSIGPEDPVDELLVDLAEDIRLELKNSGFRNKELADLSDITLSNFRRALDKVLDHPNNENLHLVLLLDEIEYLCPPWAETAEEATPQSQKIPQFLSVLRKTCQEHKNFSFALAGLASASVEAGTLFARHNPLFSYAKSYYVTPFSRDECGDLLNGIGSQLGITWSDDAIGRAYAETGGHVLFLRELASRCASSFGRARTQSIKVTGSNVDQALQEYRLSIAPQLREILAHVKRFYPDEASLLDTLFDTPEEFNAFADSYTVEAARLKHLGLIELIDGEWLPTSVLELSWRLSRGSNILKLRADPNAKPESSEIEELLKRGEGNTVEFKSSFAVALDNDAPPNSIIESSLVCLAGFMNSRGGTLLIGVRDDGTVIGLDRDLAARKSRDELIRFVTSKLNTYFGSGVASRISVRYRSVRSKEIIVIEAPASDEPIWPNKALKNRPHALWVRQGANTEGLEGRDIQAFKR